MRGTNALSRVPGARLRPQGIACALLLATLSAACAHDDVIEPGELLRGEEDASARVAGVRVRVFGDPALALPAFAVDDVTAVRLVVENHGDEPVRLRYRELSLVEPDGRQRLALPPVVVDAVPPAGVSTAFQHTRFLVAPGYERVHTSLAAWTGPFAHDPYYAPTYYARWAPPLPTTELVSRALPEGVLEPGGRVDGLVYFEGVSPLSGEVTLVVQLVSAESAALLGNAHIAFRPRPALTYSRP